MNKILNNLGLAALHVLGFKQYMLMLMGFVSHFFTILRTKKLTALDKWMSRKLFIRYRGARLCIDCQTVDRLIPEPSYTFGLVREIYISNCYFQFERLNYRFRHVVDLGGNRGIFSLLAARFSDNVIYVEAQPHYAQALVFNMQINGISNIRIVNAYMGAETALTRSGVPSKTIDDIFAEQKLDFIDFLKMDVEGSEFSLFESVTCLAKIRYIALEVHPQYGDPMSIIHCLQEHGFSTNMRDNDLHAIAQPLADRLFYIYAHNSSMISA
ncbi:hypothetical protein EH223_03835 [candidate division KSB1 bacterium]|nr:FkbM family methyltransferase [candidate division KSB1 bacterium]RQW05728.1 MAG: hypothetical protein EH223_03835 [candidate division KSB1 bacterium]